MNKDNNAKHYHISKSGVQECKNNVLTAVVALSIGTDDNCKLASCIRIKDEHIETSVVKKAVDYAVINAMIEPADSECKTFILNDKKLQESVDKDNILYALQASVKSDNPLLFKKIIEHPALRDKVNSENILGSLGKDKWSHFCKQCGVIAYHDPAIKQYIVSSTMPLSENSPIWIFFYTNPEFVPDFILSRDIDSDIVNSKPDFSYDESDAEGITDELPNWITENVKGADIYSRNGVYTADLAADNNLNIYIHVRRNTTNDLTITIDRLLNYFLNKEKDSDIISVFINEDFIDRAVKIFQNFSYYSKFDNIFNMLSEAGKVEQIKLIIEKIGVLRVFKEMHHNKDVIDIILEKEAEIMTITKAQHSYIPFSCSDSATYESDSKIVELILKINLQNLECSEDKGIKYSDMRKYINLLEPIACYYQHGHVEFAQKLFDMVVTNVLDRCGEEHIDNLLHVARGKGNALMPLFINNDSLNHGKSANVILNHYASKCDDEMISYLLKNKYDDFDSKTLTKALQTIHASPNCDHETELALIAADVEGKVSDSFVEEIYDKHHKAEDSKNVDAILSNPAYVQKIGMERLVSDAKEYASKLYDTCINFCNNTYHEEFSTECTTVELHEKEGIWHSFNIFFGAACRTVFYNNLEAESTELANLAIYIKNVPGIEEELSGLNNHLHMEL
jgi:hypothetical protein